MKQLVQNVKNGQIGVVDVPPPVLRDDGILVRNRASLISAGTERAMMKLAQKSLLGKAKERPDLVKKVLAKLQRDGFLATFKTVQNQLDRDIAMGYSIAGEVMVAGPNAQNFQAGQRVACGGAGYASHAEINYVPKLLTVPLPSGVSDEAGAYSVVGAIALQGIRNADVRVGENVVVLGLGLIGQMSVQLLKASGCRVIGLDPDPKRVELAASTGADLALVLEGEKTEIQVQAFTRDRGADAILITAATASNEPIEQAARLARDRARVVMVGVTKMDIPRKPYFTKELTFIISRSYGPGRYDTQYEEHGHDYPVGYVRWTENRNIEAFLDLIADGSIHPEMCTTHRFSIEEAEKAYQLILENQEPHLGVVLTYAGKEEAEPEIASGPIVLKTSQKPKPVDQVGISFIGAGGFARAFFLPTLAKFDDVVPRGIVTASGLSARAVGKKYGFEFCASSADDVWQDADTNAVFLMTPHSQHADGVCRTLEAGKTAFVEKPLAITLEELGRIQRTLDEHPHGLMVGFNRRFAPLATELKQFLHGRGPLTVQYRCNAGPSPAEHWISDPTEGGRIIGEACHFFDFFAYLTDSTPETVFAVAPPNLGSDDAAVSVTYANGSVCQLVYTTTGSAASSKERVEAFAGGCTGVIEDFRELQLFLPSKRERRHKLMKADKGHSDEIRTFITAVKDGSPMPIDFASLASTTLVSFATLESLRCGETVAIAELNDRLQHEDASGSPPVS